MLELLLGEDDERPYKQKKPVTPKRPLVSTAASGEVWCRSNGLSSEKWPSSYHNRNVSLFAVTHRRAHRITFGGSLQRFADRHTCQGCTEKQVRRSNTHCLDPWFLSLGHPTFVSLFGTYFLLFLPSPFFLTSGPASLIAVSRRTAAAAVYFTASFLSDMPRLIVSSTAGPPRLARASSAAAGTSQLLSPAASANVLVEAGSGSLASTLAAAVRSNQPFTSLPLSG